MAIMALRTREEQRGYYGAARPGTFLSSGDSNCSCKHSLKKSY
jgi:hypothetical protein